LIPVDFEIVKHVGAQAFVVYAALADQAADNGLVRVSQDDLAKMVGVGVSTVQRCRNRLIEAGLIKCEQIDGHTNTYRVFGDRRQDDLVQNELGQIDQGGQNDRAPGFPVLTTTSISSTSNTSLLKEGIQVLQVPDASATPDQSGALRAPLHKGDCQTDSGLGPTLHDHAPRAAGADNGRKPVPDKIPRKAGTCWQEFDDAAETLVTHFEQPVIERQKAEYARRGQTWRGKGLDKRRESWRGSAMQLLEYHPLAEVLETVDFVFGHWDGYLPRSVTRRDGRPLTTDSRGRPLKHDEDLKVTRLQLICLGYDSIRDHMAHPEITAERKIPAAPKPKPTAKQPRQSDVDDLVLQFTDFRASAGDRHVGDARIANWTKTFQIMLRQYPAEDIKAVIAAARGCPEYVDQRRYRNAYDLNRPGEWENLQGYVELHQLKETKNVEPVKPRRQFNEDDDDWRPRHRPVGGLKSVDPYDPERIRLRRLRYEARQSGGEAEKRPRPSLRSLRREQDADGTTDPPSASPTSSP
jgi:hypothetical protein